MPEPHNTTPESFRNIISRLLVNLPDEEEVNEPSGCAETPRSVQAPSSPVVSEARVVTEDDDNETSSFDLESAGRGSGFDIYLSEFPFAYLNPKIGKEWDRKKIEYTDEITLPSGKQIKRQWTIQSHSDHGLPGDQFRENIHLLVFGAE